MKAGQQAATAWNTGQKAWSAARSWFQGWNTPPQTAAALVEKERETTEAGTMPDAPPVPVEVDQAAAPLQESEKEGNGEDEVPRKPLWGPTPCCISCVSRLDTLTSSPEHHADESLQLVTEYFNAENFEGVGQGASCSLSLRVNAHRPDHLLCLNRAQANTGPEWFERTLLQLDASLLAAQGGTLDRRIQLHVWWGWQDSMVPRKGQRACLLSHRSSKADPVSRESRLIILQCGSTRH